MTTRLRPSNDFVFKRIFGVEENKDILLSFLNSTLKRPEGQELKEIELVDPHIHPDQVGDKASILDVKARTKAGERIHIEIQLHNKYDIEKRSLYYWTKLYEEQLGESQLFLKTESEMKLEELAMSEPTIRKAVDVLEFPSQDKEARRLYEMREKALRDELNMIQGAKEEGERQKALEVAKGMLSDGMSVEIIAKYTKLSIAEIEQLKRQLH